MVKTKNLADSKTLDCFKDFPGAPQGIRTPDLWFRRPTLYPAELAAQTKPFQACLAIISKKNKKVNCILKNFKVYSFLLLKKARLAKFLKHLPLQKRPSEFSY